MAFLCMETLETDNFIRIIGGGSTWFQYVDDVLVVVPKGTNIENKLRMLNGVNKDIQFTLEEEKDNRLPFLDTVIWRGTQKAKFSVYRKPTNKDDFIHYLSAHDMRTKSGVVLGFYLRAYRICSDEFIDEKIKYIISAFKRLRYPEGLLLKLKHKAIKIVTRNKKNEDCDAGKNSTRYYICVLNSSKAHIINRELTKSGLKIATTTGRKIGDVVKTKETRMTNDNSVIYSIPCKGCNKIYVGETGRGLKKWVTEHRRDVKKHNTSNSLV